MTQTLPPFRAKVMNSGKKAILMLPPRSKVPHMPLGETTVVVNGSPVVAKFAKIAVNVMQIEGANALTAILQGMFGEDAGRPGTRSFVEFTDEGGALVMRPVTE